jgi:hypothetical protein
MLERLSHAKASGFQGKSILSHPGEIAAFIKAADR